MPLYRDVHNSLPAGAPDADAAYAVHRAAHGLVADEICPVGQG